MTTDGWQVTRIVLDGQELFRVASTDIADAVNVSPGSVYILANGEFWCGDFTSREAAEERTRR